MLRIIFPSQIRKKDTKIQRKKNYFQQIFVLQVLSLTKKKYQRLNVDTIDCIYYKLEIYKKLYYSLTLLIMDLIIIKVDATINLDKIL